MAVRVRVGHGCDCVQSAANVHTTVTLGVGVFATVGVAVGVGVRVRVRVGVALNVGVGVRVGVRVRVVEGVGVSRELSVGVGEGAGVGHVSHVPWLHSVKQSFTVVQPIRQKFPKAHVALSGGWQSPSTTQYPLFFEKHSPVPMLLHVESRQKQPSSQQVGFAFKHSVSPVGQ